MLRAHSTIGDSSLEGWGLRSGVSVVGLGIFHSSLCFRFMYLLQFPFEEFWVLDPNLVLFSRRKFMGNQLSQALGDGKKVLELTVFRSPDCRGERHKNHYIDWVRAALFFQRAFRDILDFGMAVYFSYHS
jgi:hypothetical protein